MSDRRFKLDHTIDSRIKRERIAILVRYDFDNHRWMHSPGIALSPTESAVLASLQYGAKNKEIARAICLSESRVEKIIIGMKRKFNTSGCPAISRSQLMKISKDLFI